MKLFISLIASFFLITACSDNSDTNGEESPTTTSDTPEEEITPVQTSVTCVPHERNEENIPVPIAGGTHLELTQSGVFDCPQAESYDCTRCELSVSSSGATSIHYSCTGQGSAGSVAVRSGTFIAQIGMSCTKMK